MVNDAGCVDCIACVAGDCDNAVDAGAGQWLNRAFYSRGGIAFVCGYFAGDISGMYCAKYAAAGNAAYIGIAADADAFRRLYSYGKYAALGAVCNAGGSDDSFCGILSVHIVPRCRGGCGVEAVFKVVCDRQSALCFVVEPFPEKRSKLKFVAC